MIFRGTADRQRGATLIEGAIITPVFFLMVLGLFDGSWALFANHVLEGSSSAGVRTVSALANDGTADFDALQKVKSQMSTLGAGRLQRVVIYRANGLGEAPHALVPGRHAFGGHRHQQGRGLQRVLGGDPRVAGRAVRLRPSHQP